MTNHKPMINDDAITDPRGGFPQVAGDLEAGLAEASAPVTPPVEIWKSAMAEADVLPPRRQRRVFVWAAASVAAAVMLVAGGALVLPQLGQARSSARVPYGSPAVMEKAIGFDPQASFHMANADDRPASYALMPPVGDRKMKWTNPRGSAQESNTATSEDASRSIVRRATIDVACEDVRSAYAQAMIVPSDALGEFTESASLTGDGDAARADITFRVRSERISLVLTQIRALGKPTSESLNSVDVTDRLIDLDATIRNEKKVEADLLDLADQRKGAALKEILELRGQLSDIRTRIEKLEAQKSNTNKQVEFSTIVLTLHHEAKAETPVETPKADFGSKLSAAWSTGTSGLGDSLAWCVESGIAHLPTWVAIGAFGLAIWVGVRRAIRWSGQEPKPRLG